MAELKFHRIDAKEAIKTSSEYFKDIFDLNDFRLEEIELKGNHWHITFSYLVPPIKDPLNPLNFKQTREYKVVKIDANSGKTLSIKIR